MLYMAQKLPGLDKKDLYSTDEDHLHLHPRFHGVRHSHCLRRAFRQVHEPVFAESQENQPVNRQRRG